MPETRLEDARCPACASQGMIYVSETIDLPYLGESMESSLRCEVCGFRHNDFILATQGSPLRHSLRVAREEHLSYRVVRASSGTIRIPELGIMIEPGVAADAFISNIEGIYFRVEKILSQLARDPDVDADGQQKIQEIYQRFAQSRNGEGAPLDVIIEDPFGNSRILGDDVVEEAIPADEAAKLAVGAFTIDQDYNPGDLAPSS